jgi:hypothetical protein
MSPADLPSLTLVRQKYPSRALADVDSAARAALDRAPWRSRVRSGMRIAVAAGSRGISNYATVVRAACDHLRALGADAFIFPCMGSHGSATAEGQIAVLRESGITLETMGVPILSDINPVHLGRSPSGMDVYMDRNAHAADAFLLINRVKWHTDFAGTIESGLMKMMAMGIGKPKGAQIYHARAIRAGEYEAAIRDAAGTVLTTGKSLGGVAILEDSYHHTATIETVDAAELPGREEHLLAEVKQWAPSFNVNEIDLLIVDVMGKDVSGAGLDTKVINRSVHGEANIWPGLPKIHRIYVRDISDHSYGNAVGIGMVEAISERLASKIDWAPTRVNALTASTPRNIRLPLTFATDREATLTLLGTVGLSSPAEARIAWIYNTLELANLAVTSNLFDEMRSRIDLEIRAKNVPLQFDSAGQLTSPFTAAFAA